MERLTNDNPQNNFSIMLNYVFSKGGQAYIRSDGTSEEPMLLTEWANRMCMEYGCGDENFSNDSPHEIDERICDCAMVSARCPIFLAYIFACQAVHLRDRLKFYEDAEEGPGCLLNVSEPEPPQ